MARTILTLSLALALAGGAFSQDQKTAEQKPVDPPKPATQDPKKPAEIDRVDELKAQLERARAELDATRKMVEAGGLPALVMPFLTRRVLDPRVVDLGVDAIPQPVAGEVQPAKATGVRLLGDAEKERLGPDVIATVDGEPISRAEFDAMFAYESTRPNVEAEEQNKRDALRALVIQKAALAQFKGNAVAAKERITEIEEMLAGGADFAEVARKNSQCPSAAQGGDLGMFGRGAMDPMFERAAFETKVGETSDIVQSGFGYHIVKVTAHEKGDPDKGTAEQVRASHILVMFDDDQQAIRQVMKQAMNGQVDLAFASEDWRKLSPF